MLPSGTSIAEVKAGRRNSAKDAEELEHIRELASSIQSVIDGLLAEQREEPDEQGTEPEGQPKANAEEPDGANAEEPEAKSEELEALLQQASEILTTKEG